MSKSKVRKSEVYQFADKLLDKLAEAYDFVLEQPADFIRDAQAIAATLFELEEEKPAATRLGYDEVDHAYEGERDACACGCSGVHYSSVEDPSREFDPETVKYIVDRINDAIELGNEEVHDEGGHVYAELGGDLLIAYRKEKK